MNNKKKLLDIKLNDAGKSAFNNICNCINYKFVANKMYRAK